MMQSFKPVIPAFIIEGKLPTGKEDPGYTLTPGYLHPGANHETEEVPTGKPGEPTRLERLAQERTARLRQAGLDRAIRDDSMRVDPFQFIGRDSDLATQLADGMKRRAPGVVFTVPRQERQLAYCIKGNDDGPAVYVTNPQKVLCGSCRTPEARMDIAGMDLGVRPPLVDPEKQVEPDFTPAARMDQVETKVCEIDSIRVFLIK